MSNHRISHLVVDYDLGHDVNQQPYPDGYVLAHRWIREYSNIKQAIIFTGEGPECPELSDIPIIHKPISIRELVRAIRDPWWP
ncbi:MAG: hypothetical protein GY847_32165 [Proteobacteria bacterium]|nr:hypothetical protein [Pseudomonadota bacterium]